MAKRMASAAFVAIGIACCFASSVAAGPDAGASGDIRPSAWIVELGGYGIFEPEYLGSNRYSLGFKPIIDVHKPGDRVWLSFPNDAFTYDLYETANFHAGVAGDLTLQSRRHGENFDLRLGSADVNLRGGGFAEYYPTPSIRTRVEVLQGLTGNTGLAANLSADYIWKPDQALTLTLGPRTQIVNDEYASDFFSTELAKKHGTYIRYKAEGGFLSAGGEFTGTYDWSRTISTKLFVDYTHLLGDAADSPRVDLKGSASQVIIGLGASYKFAIEP